MLGLPVVIDASFSLSMLLDHPFQEASLVVADELKRARKQFIAPDLWAYETTSSVCKAVHFGLIDQDEARQILALLWALGVQLIFPEDIHNQRAFDLTVRLKRAASYDSYYMALAESMKCDLWTADKKLYRVAQANDMPWVHHVGEVLSSR
ncbi:MAG: type II toxin-antitoxin system VapC family toxin [Chloroflexi bacterium]|nr:type II toxin-antitoxin system VapC family toxin [Chloroflexota bacterium]